MFIIHTIKSQNRSYINTGIDNNSINMPPMEIFSTVLGEVPPDIEDAYKLLAQCNPSEPTHRLLIEEHINKLSKIDVGKLNPVAFVTVVTVVLKFRLYIARNMREAKRFDDYSKKHLSKCWDMYLLIFQTIIQDECDIERFAKFVSRFAHFYQMYQAMSLNTANNKQHNLQLATLLASGLLKHLPAIHPQQIGRYYTAPKMVREILLSMSLKFKCDELNDILIHVLTMSYDYFNSLQAYEFKRDLVDSILVGRRAALDRIIEEGFLGDLQTSILSSLARKERDFLNKYTAESYQVKVIKDYCQLMLINSFGCETELAYLDNILHIKIIMSNEVREGILLILVYNRKIITRQIPYDISELFELIKINFDKATCGDEKCYYGFTKIFNNVLPTDSRDEITRFVIKNKIKQIYIHPDGCLWYLPWCYLMQNEFKCKKIAIPNVAIKLTSKSTLTSFNATKALIIGCWEYNDGVDNSRKRGDYKHNNLEYVKQEIDALNHIVSNLSVECITDDICDANQVINYIKACKTTTIVHIACHGDSQFNTVPSLKLSAKNGFSSLHYEKILRADWSKCELVFINSCFGGAFESFVGGSPIGILESLYIAGAKIVVAPLWPIDDSFAMTFAMKFYEGSGATKDYLEGFTSTMSLGLDDSKGCLTSLMGYNFYII